MKMTIEEYEKWKTERSKIKNKPRKPLVRPWFLYIYIAVVIVILTASFRVYYGGNIGLKIVIKKSFSFKDNIVNLDDIFGQPRIAVAINHPAVKQQLEDMGIIETDEKVKEKIYQEQMRRIYEYGQ